MDLLLSDSIFLPVAGDCGNYYQLSGFPISELKPELTTSNASPSVLLEAALLPPRPTDEVRKPTAITFVRSRMLYAKAALNAKGGVRFGMRHIRWVSLAA